MGSPIKRLLSRAQTFPSARKIFQALSVRVAAINPIADISVLFRSQPLLHQSPIRIKAIGEAMEIQGNRGVGP